MFSCAIFVYFQVANHFSDFAEKDIVVLRKTAIDLSTVVDHAAMGS